VDRALHSLPAVADAMLFTIERGYLV